MHIKAWSQLQPAKKHAINSITVSNLLSSWVLNNAAIVKSLCLIGLNVDESNAL